MIPLDHPPYLLRALGGAALTSTVVPTPAAAGRPRLIALLALACGAGRRGITRERAAVALWPEVSDAHARNDLKQLVFVARRAFGNDLFVSDSASLIINESILSSDVSAFHRAFGERRLEDAVRLYGGPFLDGFHISGRPELERLIEVERSRCVMLYTDALEDLAAGAEARRDHRTALLWWRLLVAVDPLRDDYAMGLMGALADSGELSGALMHARRYAQLVLRELDTELGAEVNRFVLSLPERARAAARAWHPALDTTTVGRSRDHRRHAHSEAPTRATWPDAPSASGRGQWNQPQAVADGTELHLDQPLKRP